MKSVDKDGGENLGSFRGRYGHLPDTSMTEVSKYDKEGEDGSPPAGLSKNP